MVLILWRGSSKMAPGRRKRLEAGIRDVRSVFFSSPEKRAPGTTGQIKWFLLIFLLLLLPGFLDARSVPTAKLPLCDEAGILDLKAKESVRQICFDLQQEIRAELAILIIRSTSGENHHDFALKTFNQWGIGQRGIDNGMLIMFAIDDRRVEIIPGTRYKDAFDQPTCTQLLVDYVVPKMKAGKPGEGVFAAAREVAARVRSFEKNRKMTPATPERSPGKKAQPSGQWGASHIPSKPSVPAPIQSTRSSGLGFFNVPGLIFIALLGGWFFLGFIFFVAAFKGGNLLMPKWVMFPLLLFGGAGLAYFAVKHLNFDNSLQDQVSSGFGVVSLLVFGFWGSHMCPHCNRYMSVNDRTLKSATTYSSGMGERTEHCESCGYHNVYTFTIARVSKSSSHHSSSRSSSSRSSGGGGRSSGGGGGASW